MIHDNMLLGTEDKRCCIILAKNEQNTSYRLCVISIQTQCQSPEKMLILLHIKNEKLTFQQ